MQLVTGQTRWSWKKFLQLLKLQEDENDPIQEKLIQLGFLRRYPDYYENNSITRSTRISVLEVSLEDGLALLKPTASKRHRGHLTLEERSKRLHPADEHEDFLIFSKRVAPHLAEKYLEILAELVEHFCLMPDDIRSDIGGLPVGSGTLAELVTGQTRWSWKKFLQLLKLQEDENDPIQENLIQLGFLRRYPDYYENDSITQPTRILVLEVSSKDGLATLKDATEPVILSKDVIEKGYLSDYVGYDDIVIPILRTLNQHASEWQQTKYLAPYTSLIGPTMSGKTRFLMEVAQEVCVVYICLRPSNSSGEPKRSQLATEMLQTPPLADLEGYYIKLITAILSSTVKNLSHGTDAVSQLTSAARTLAKTRVLKDSPLKVMLAIDKASALLDKPDNRTDSSASPTQEVPLFCFFCRALRNIPDNSGVFTILVDTNSRVANFNPRGEDDPSSRPMGLRAEPFKVYPPIYELRTFDRMVSPKPPRTWKHLFLPERLCNYGIPFYGIYLKLALEAQVAEDPAAAVDKMATYALKKLLCYQNAGPIEITESRALALLGPTIGVPLHGQARQNVKLTASHAAHCGYIDADRDCQYSFYPSQPIYALAANNYLQKNEDVLISCINTLTAILSQGQTGTGDVGEIASRIILLCAMNKTADDMKTAKKPADMKIAKKTMVNPTKLFDEGVMFWNHFMHCSHRPTSESLLECMHRGLALQCRPNQEAFDQVLTVYLKQKSKAKLDEANVTFCGIQVKNRKDDSQLKTAQQNMNPETARINMKEADNPYLALYFTFQKNPPRKDNGERRDCYKLPSVGPPDHRQASLVFYGLDSFQFLSPGLKNALKELLNIRTGLVWRHGNRRAGQEYAKDFLLRANACQPS
ncbi:uncharacterized protein PGTG_11691 [Puccinia graminis f. sp. tritici CRL 75-36-700-3]|uniref:Uncharacterized protein n=1 Tax=Puccinia graminis f. sp. tritici (strain CRL 75-36-700-3 / race SCCL) TaxID=418459 RepID=E3KNR0_PUCGT|nr:uncharacterized protein PGTG_11691 [Puccinia graminis f. sp. tritici CRL 75-36-700-3]EFP85935.2 hypothetical protein PGTG_11691 [Puccinia graminis f. sp. tritici CRL 75-36-700-3]